MAEGLSATVRLGTVALWRGSGPKFAAIAAIAAIAVAAIAAAIAGAALAGVAASNRRDDPGKLFVACLSLGRRLDKLDLGSRVHAKEFVLPLPDFHRQGASLHITSNRLLKKYLREPIELAEVGLDHPQTRLKIGRPQPLQYDVDFFRAEPELLLDRSHRSASHQRLSNGLVTLLDCCVGHG